MDGWNNGTVANPAGIDEVNRNSTKSKQEVRFLLVSSIFDFVELVSSVPIFRYSTDSNGIN